MLVAVAVFYFLRKKSANTRYLAGVGFLFAQVVASVGTFIYYYPKTTTAISNAKLFGALHRIVRVPHLGRGFQ